MQLSLQPEPYRKAFEKIRAIIFDLHQTLSSATTQIIIDVLRKASERFGIDLSAHTDEQLWDAMSTADLWKNEKLVERNVAFNWGHTPEDWIEANRVLFGNLGVCNVSDETLHNVENQFQQDIIRLDFEVITEDAKETLRELSSRGYLLGIATRRFTNPRMLLERYGIYDLFSTVIWTAVPGYAKPSPFSLLETAKQMNINPRLCAYVGNYVDVDIVAAQNAEMLPVLTVWANPDEVENAPFDLTVIDSLSELLRLFKGL